MARNRNRRRKQRAKQREQIAVEPSAEHAISVDSIANDNASPEVSDRGLDTLFEGLDEKPARPAALSDPVVARLDDEGRCKVDAEVEDWLSLQLVRVIGYQSVAMARAGFAVVADDDPRDVVLSLQTNFGAFFFRGCAVVLRNVLVSLPRDVGLWKVFEGLWLEHLSRELVAETDDPGVE